MVSEGWYIPQVPALKHGKLFPRWVLGVIHDRICYSKGGDEHYSCQTQTFINWVKRTKAELQRSANTSTEK